MVSIIIKGGAGQGVQLVGSVLANVLKDSNYNIALTRKYSALMRSGKSSVSLAISEKKIENPIIEKPDFEFDMEDKELQAGLLKMCNNPKVINMVLLGKIFRKLEAKIDNEQIKKYLPSKFLDENLAAIKMGYES